MSPGGRRARIGQVAIDAVGWLIVTATLGYVLYIPFAGHSRRERMHVRRAESTARMRLGHVASAMETFRRLNGGLGVPVECLRQPRACLPELETAGPLLGPDVAFDVAQDDYVLRVARTIAADPAEVAAATRPLGGRASAQSLRAWVVTAETLDPSGRSRSFCVDAGGQTCALSPEKRDFTGGWCAPSCAPAGEHDRPY